MTLAPASDPRHRAWRPGRPVDLGATLGPLRRGGGDPTFRVVGTDIWRTALTPAGPATQRIAPVSDGVDCQAWGPGADWLLETLPDLLGAGDRSVGEFDPRHPLVRESWRRHRGWRVPRSNLVTETLVATVLEQKVTGGEARESWRRLVLDHGSPAPGPAPRGMRVAPDPATWARLPSWTWHRAGVGPDRSRTIVGAASRAAALERTLGGDAVGAVGAVGDRVFAEADRRLRSLPGIGPWTSAEVRQRAHGDPDAVSVGDLHLAGQVVWALTGVRGGDDDAMLDLLAPYAGHRYRVVRMVELAGVTQPRRAPRYAPLDHRSR